MAPIDMRYFAAREEHPAEYCRARVRGCDVYVGLIGLRYGSIVPEEETSYTELEFLEAGRAGIPRLIFMLDEFSDVPSALIDVDRTAIDAFRLRLRGGGLIVCDFATPDRLELHVYQALTEMQGPLHQPPGAVRGCMLPPDLSNFTGRGSELGAMTAAILAEASHGERASIHTIEGMPGVGKTALAVRVAYMLAGHFPDGQFFLDLRGHTPGQVPMAPTEALTALLMADGLDFRRLPDSIDELSRLWRVRTVGRRVLLVLDNTADSRQITPLLTGGSSSTVLITSRRHLGDLPTVRGRLRLPVLPADEANAMFVSLSDRAGNDPSAMVDQLVAQAGALPLAIALVAKVYTRHEAWSLQDLLSETRTRLLDVAAENATVAAAFGLSYDLLTSGQQRLFLLLGMHPGTTVDPYGAAALTGRPLIEAIADLDTLHANNLLIEVGYRRYTMHDLIRQYARTLAALVEASEIDEPLQRLLCYYHMTASRAAAYLATQTRPATTVAPAAVEIPDIDTDQAALTWLRTERANIIAGLHHTTDPRLVVLLTAGLTDLIRLDGPWAQALTFLDRAVVAAEQLGDDLLRANAFSDLGILKRVTGDYAGAEHALREALNGYRRVGERHGWANSLDNLGCVQYLRGEHATAAQSLREALAVHRDTGDRFGQAHALGELGVLLRRTGDYLEAENALTEALDIYRDLGRRRGQANTLNSLGGVRYLTGDFAGSAQVLDSALTIYQELGNRLGQVYVLTDIGAVGYLTGNLTTAAEALGDAVELARDLGERVGQVHAQVLLGGVRRTQGHYGEAETQLQEALTSARDLGDLFGQAKALTFLGGLRGETDRHTLARQDLSAALDMFDALGDRGGKATVLNELGQLHRTAGEVEQAGSCHRAALDLARQIDSPWDQAHAMTGLARYCLITGRPDEASTYFHEALQIFRRINAVEADRIAAELGALT